MAVITRCPYCERPMKILEESLGKLVRCPHCQGTFTTTAIPRGAAGNADQANAPPAPRLQAAAPASAPRPAPAPTKAVTPPTAPAPVTSREATARPAGGSKRGADPRSLAKSPPTSIEQPEPEQLSRQSSSAIEFDVVIKRDPARSVSGTFKGKLTRAGLCLRQNKLDFQLPVGTAVSYRDGSRLGLPLEGREVVVAIAKPRWYTARLARDVAEFLNGRTKMLTAENYVIPVSLLILTMLPVGIAAAGIMGRTLGTGGVAGILNGALWGGLGGGLTGLCWWLCQREHWPLAARIGACLGISVIGYGVLGVAVLFRLGSGIAGSEWHEFSPPGSRCSVLLPGTPVGRDQTVPTAVGNVRAHLFTVERSSENVAFMLVYSDYPDSVAKADVNQLFDGAQQGAAANIKGKVVSQEPVALGVSPGREVLISIPGQGNMLVRYYLAGNRLYQVAAAGKRIGRQSADVQKLFASFKILAQEGQAQPAKVQPDQEPARLPQPKLPTEIKPVPKPAAKSAGGTSDADGRILLRGSGDRTPISAY